MRFAVIVLTSTLAACSALLGIRDTTDEPAGVDSEDAGAGAMPADEEDGGSLVLPTDDDASHVAPTVDAVPCLPVRAFVPFASGPGSGVTCNVDGVLPGSVAPTGLDYVDISNYGDLAGVKVTACVAVDLPRAAVEVRVRASAVVQGCQRPCSGSYCGLEGRRAHVFAGSVGASLRWLGRIGLEAAPADYVLPVPADLAATQVLVCRTGANVDSEDVHVHAISAMCLR